MATFLRTFLLDSHYLNSRLTLFVSVADKYADMTYVRGGLIKATQKVLNFDEVRTPELAEQYLKRTGGDINCESLVETIHKGWQEPVEQQAA